MSMTDDPKAKAFINLTIMLLRFNIRPVFDFNDASKRITAVNGNLTVVDFMQNLKIQVEEYVKRNE